MSEGDPTRDPGPTNASQPINYRDKKDDLPNAKKSKSIAVGVGIGVAITVFGLVCLWILFGINAALTARKDAIAALLIPGALTAAAIVTWCFVLYRKRRIPGILQGALIGLGVAILIEGACWMINIH